MLLGKRRRKETEVQAAVRALVDLDAPASDAETDGLLRRSEAAALC